jgi:hypothetical protein
MGLVHNSLGNTYMLSQSEGSDVIGDSPQIPFRLMCVRCV